MPRPASGEYAAFYQNYVALAEGENISEVVNKYAFNIQEFYNSLPAEKEDYAYSEGKWTVKQVLQHVTDAERVFIYRALRISRNDPTPMASFDENEYVKNGFAETRTLSSLKQEFNAVRAATDMFLLSLNETQIQRTGIASGHTVSVNALGFIIYGHLLHHRNILKERYGI
jgi:uncharacterized damage-inducible protein DinB